MLCGALGFQRAFCDRCEGRSHCCHSKILLKLQCVSSLYSFPLELDPNEVAKPAAAPLFAFGTPGSFPFFGLLEMVIHEEEEHSVHILRNITSRIQRGAQVSYETDLCGCLAFLGYQSSAAHCLIRGLPDLTAVMMVPKLALEHHPAACRLRPWAGKEGLDNYTCSVLSLERSGQ